MTTNKKRIHGLSVVGFIFFLTGGTWIAVGQPAIGFGMFGLGITLFCVGVAAARKAAALKNNTNARPTVEGREENHGAE